MNFYGTHLKFSFVKLKLLLTPSKAQPNHFIFSSTTLHQLRRLPPLFPFLIHSTKTSLPLWYSRNFPPYSLIKVHVKAIPKMPPLATILVIVVVFRPVA